MNNERPTFDDRGPTRSRSPIRGQEPEEARNVGKIAHDLNNALMTILSNGELLDLSLSPEMTEEREEVEDIVLAARHGAELVRELRRIANRQEQGA